MLISEQFREQNRLLHEQRPDYGVGGHKHAAMVRQLAEAMNTYDILDYGCGKKTLADALDNYCVVRNYDPAFAEIAKPPEPADLVVCTDVLEHIEPECLDDVLDDLRRVTRKMILLDVATRPAVKCYPDGRNTHLIQQDLKWWVPKIWDRFVIGSIHNLGGEVLMTCGVL